MNEDGASEPALAEVEEVSDPPVGRIVGLIALLALLILYSYYRFVTCWLPTWLERAQFGDMFGGTNALFSGLALAGVVAAIWLQRKELALQRLELRETRRELARTAVAQIKSANLIEEQYKLARLTTQIAEAESYARTAPDLRWVGEGFSSGKYQVRLKNLGETLTDVEFKHTVALTRLVPNKLPVIYKGEEFNLVASFPTPHTPPFDFGLSFTDILFRSRIRRFTVDTGSRAIYSVPEGPYFGGIYGPQGEERTTET